MSGTLNKVTLIANVGRDPEIRTFNGGGKVCNLRVATSETWRDKQSGERKERTEWHSVAIFNEVLIKVAEQYVRKGSKIYIEGQLETRKWQDQGGNDRYTTEIVLRPYRGELTLLDSAQSRSGDRDERGGEDGHSGMNGSAAHTNGGGGGYGPSTVGGIGLPGGLDDEIPFDKPYR